MKTDSQERGRVFLSAIGRVNRIHKTVAAGGFPSTAQLAELCGVSIRTIKRDLDALRYDQSAPLKYDTVKRGFYYTEPTWSPGVHRLSDGDLLAFFIAENALRLTGQTPEALQLRKSLNKLASMLPDEVSINLFTLAESLSFQNPAFEKSEPETLQRLAKAATEQTTVRFKYFSRHSGKITERSADVYQLHNFSGDWYAISFDHKSSAMRDFHIGRISNLEVLNQSFEINKSLWNREEYRRREFNMMRGGRLTTVQILFDPYQSQWIRNRTALHEEETREELPDGSLRLTFPVGENGLEAVARFCLQYAGNCVAEKPKKLREIIRAKLDRAMEQHD